MDRMEASTPWTMPSVDAKTTCTALSVSGVVVAAVNASCKDVSVSFRIPCLGVSCKDVLVSFRIPCLDDSNESVATMTANATAQHVFWSGDREGAVKDRYIQANDWIGIGCGCLCDLNCREPL